VRFKVDENLPIEVAEVLRKAGHESATVIEESMAGASDPDLAAMVRRERRALITLDVGFGDIRTYPPEDFEGIIVLRLARQNKEHVLHVCERLMKHLPSAPLVGQLWIVETNRIRVRLPKEA
jgi:predicted nuclease of predicted toxin-antitoxin system